MTTLADPGVAALLDKPNYAVIATTNADGSLHTAVVWADVIDGKLAVNSAVGRKWPSNVDRNAQVSVLIYDQSNPYDYVEVRGKATGTTDGADDHIDRLAKKYLNQDSYPFRRPDEQRITYVIEPTLVRHQKQ
jgi:PPOX class probable F420-dependent enzyme